MKKLNSFILNFLLLSFFVILLSAVFHIRFEKVAQIWLLSTVGQDLLFFLPVNAALSVLWALVIRDKSEAQAPVSKATQSFMIIVYFFIILGAAFILQEVGIPKLYQNALYQADLKSKKIVLKSKITDTTGTKFSMKEFEQVRKMPVRENIAFSMGNSLVYFGKMYDGGGSFYVNQFRLIAYNNKRQLDYILTSENAKIVDDEIHSVSPMFYQYKGGELVSSRKISGIKKVPVMYGADAVYAISSEASTKMASLIDIFLYNDYVYGSKISFFHLGNIVFNKVAYYIILFFMLIIASAVGSAFRNQRLLYRDYIQTVCFFILSGFLTFAIYDTCVAAVNMIYGLVI